MTIATRSLNVVITGDAKQLGVATKKAEGHIGGLASRGAKMGKTLALGFAAGGAAAGGALVVGLKKSVDAAMESEKSQAKLEAQMKASGLSYRAHAKEIDAVIQKHSKLAGVDDEDLQDAFTGLVRSTGSVKTAMKDMGLVTDLMRAKNMDASKAGDLLAKVHNGNVGALKRMGIAIKPVTDAQDKLKASNQKATEEQKRAAKEADKAATSQSALAELQKRFGGQAEAYGKTAAGAQERFGVAVENLQEKIGAKLLPIVASVTNKVADFVGGMESGKGAGGRFAAAVSDGFNKAKDAVAGAIRAIKRWLDQHRGDINSVISAFRRVGSFARDVFQDTLLPIIRRAVGAIKPIIEGIATTIRGVVRMVSGILSGDFDKAWDGAKEAVRGAWKAIKTIVKTATENLQELIKDLGPKIVKLIGKGLEGVGKTIWGGIKAGIQWVKDNLPRLAGEALKGIGKGIMEGVKKGLGKLNPFGDGLGKVVGDGIGQMLPAFGGGLMGARPGMAPVAGIASRFGLHVSSGLRPGAVTSSGNKSYHSTGEALDIAGTPAGMLGFFRFMKNTMGPRLAELIYTPGGAGVHNGRSHTYSGQVAAEHFDHVHVAVDSGVPGVGDGLGRLALRRAATGDGIGQIRNLWTRAGGSAGVANMAAAIAMAESGGDPSQTHRNSDGSVDRGLWQINSVHGPLSTLDRVGNAKAAVQISSNGRNWNPWTVFRTGAYKKFLTTGGSGRSGAGSTSTSFNPNASGTADTYRGRTASGVGSINKNDKPKEPVFGPGAAGRTYEGALERIELGKAENDGNTQKTIKLLFEEAVLKRRRLAKIKRTLKRKLRAETRSRLMQEATQLVADLREISSLMFDLTDGKSGMKDGVAGGPGVSADGGGGGDGASGGGSGGGGGSGSDGGFVSPFADRLAWDEANLALAGLTPGLEDDIAAATDIRSVRGGELELALASGDPFRVKEAAANFQSAIEAVNQLTGAMNEANEIQRQRDDLNRQIADNQVKILALANQGPQIVAAVVAAVNGGIGGRVGSALMSPGYPGGGANYGTGRL